MILSQLTISYNMSFCILAICSVTGRIKMIPVQIFYIPHYLGADNDASPQIKPNNDSIPVQSYYPSNYSFSPCSYSYPTSVSSCYSSEQRSSTIGTTPC